MKTFEYRLRLDPSILEINDCGKSGWELVSVVYNSNTGVKTFYFKREKL